MITSNDVLAQFDKIDTSEHLKSAASVLPAIREALKIRMETFKPSSEAGAPASTGKKFGFRSRYVQHGKSEEEAAVAELLEELIDALNYLMIFKHMYSSMPETDIPPINNILKTLEGLLVAALVTSLMLGVEASRLALLEQEEIEKAAKR